VTVTGNQISTCLTVYTSLSRGGHDWTLIPQCSYRQHLTFDDTLVDGIHELRRWRRGLMGVGNVVVEDNNSAT
jgi:hypothetical protein